MNPTKCTLCKEHSSVPKSHVLGPHRLEADEFVLAGRVLEIAQHERDPEVWFADRLGVARPAAAVLDHATAIRAVADDGDVGLDEQQLAIEADADDVGGVGTRGSGEGMCLRRWLHDRYARRAAARSTRTNSSPAESLCIGHSLVKLEDEHAVAGDARVVGWYGVTNLRAGRGRAGQASAGTEDTPCALTLVGARR